MNQNVPAISSSNYATTAYDGAQMANGLAFQASAPKPLANGLAGQNAALGKIVGIAPTVANNQFQQKGNPMSARRLVQVVIVDPNENISLDDCLLFKGEEKLTDATDQELFFELDIKDILEKHNAMRSKVIDKKVKDRTEYLESAKIRDLKMVVVNIAQF